MPMKTFQEKWNNGKIHPCDWDESPAEDDSEPMDEEGLMKEKVKKTGYKIAIR